MCIYIYICIYIYVYRDIPVCICIYIYIERERDYGSHIDASRLRQPLVKGYEVNAVSLDKGGIFGRGGCIRRGVQWMGVACYIEK